jgi:ABC-2 type transport system ATP-binding protein
MSSPPYPSEEAVVVENLVKCFARRTAVDHVSFAVARGQMFGLIGPDGAGKTTLFRLLVTLLVPDAGTARVLGRDVVRDIWQLRQRVGYMPGRFALYPDLSVDENLRFFASVFGTTVDREYGHIAPIFDQLKPFASRRAGALSGGMKQKLALCCALVHRPEILFLDEPTTGVDAVSRREFWDLLAGFKHDGLTVVVSTPYMDEANRCDRIALVESGRLLAIDTPEAVATSFGRPLFAVRADRRYPALLALREHPETYSAYPFGEVLHYADRRTGADAARIAREIRDFLTGKGLSGIDVARIDPSVEDSFIARMADRDRAPSQGAA